MLAAVLALVSYVRTAAPGLVWGDGIELAAVCASLGIAHPTGYPLFTLLGHLFTHLPVGSIPFRVTLFCAVSMAAVIVCMERQVHRTLQTTAGSGSGTVPGRLACFAGALAFAWSLSPWTHATRTEVYALQLLVQSVLVLIAWDLLTPRGGGGDVDLFRSSRRPFAVSFLLGLGFAHHLLTLVLLPFAVTVAWRHLRAVTGSRRRYRVLAHGLALALGLLPILYLPLRAAQMPDVSWGNPSTVEGLWWTLSGGDFPSDLFLAEKGGTSFSLTGFFAHVEQRSQALAYYLLGTIMPLAGLHWGVRWAGFLLGCLCVGRGVIHLWPRRRAFLGAWGVSLMLYGGILFTYNIGDIADYQLGFLALIWPVAWLGAWCFARCEPWLDGVSWGMRPSQLRRRGVGPAARFALTAFLLVLPLALWWGNRSLADRSDETLVDRFAERLLADLPPHSILLTQGDFSTATAWYRQAVVGERPDVLVFCLDFFYDDWYGELMSQRDLAGRQVATSQTGGEWGEPFIDALDRLIVAPNPTTPVLIMPSPRQAKALTRRFELSLEQTLLDADELAAYELKGWRAPQPHLVRLRSRPRPPVQSP